MKRYFSSYLDLVRLTKYLARAGWILSLVLLGAYKHFDCDDYLRIVGNALWPFSQFPLGSADRYLSDYAVCAMVLLNFYCALNVELIFPNKLAGLLTNKINRAGQLLIQLVLI